MKRLYRIPFNKPHITLKEFSYIKDAHARGHLSGDGYYTKRAHALLERKLNIKKTLLTHSCTAALEMMAILANVSHGDEVIMPSFTFVSTANAFVLRGATPVFVDIRKDTLNMNEKLIEDAITLRTKAIVPVHYAGVSCDMASIMRIAKKHNLLVLEDAAQGLASQYKGKYLGTIGHLGAYSFHETKNIISGEGGALTINRKSFIERAEIIREKGTNRSKFFRGQVDKYTWIDIGSSYLPSEVTAAFFLAQFEKMSIINQRRLQIWTRYHKSLENLENKGFIRRPIIPKDCTHNGHMYYILVKNLQTRTALLKHLKSKGILSVFHYVPLHSSPAGKKYGRVSGKLSVTNKTADTLIRLPLFYDLQSKEQTEIIQLIQNFFA